MLKLARSFATGPLRQERRSDSAVQEEVLTTMLFSLVSWMLLTGSAALLWSVARSWLLPDVLSSIISAVALLSSRRWDCPRLFSSV
jgi:hypothetical protein